MDTIKKIMLLLVLVIGFSSCVVGYYSPAPYRYHSRPRYHGWGYYHHSQYNGYHGGKHHYGGRPGPVRHHFGPR